MAEAGTIWRMTVAGLAVWRLARLLFEDADHGEGWEGASRLLHLKPESFLGNRVMDLLYWLHVWLSAQTALWVACGFAIVFVSWLVAAVLSRAATGIVARRSHSRPHRARSHSLRAEGDRANSASECRLPGAAR